MPRSGDRRIRDTFVAALGFDLDPFQAAALDALDAGHSVVVAAPTGSGKTVVAEYGIEKALAEGQKAFYTTPLKALSNQKYGDLVRRHGVERIGLLTGDNAIRGDAPVVVMTTEVLRNMIYAASDALVGLRYVILDEVHYLQNAYRGPVWEEVIIHAPPEIDLICLSATVSNAEELADWIRTVRGHTEAVIEERRPVELQNLYLVGSRTSPEPFLLPTLVDGRPNPEALAIDSRAQRFPGPRGRSRGRLYAPRRAEVVEVLHAREMLPAIYFIFSRAACDDAVAQCVRDGLRLTTVEERRQIRAIAEAKVEALSDEDLRVLDYGTWVTGLEAGFAAHHAGMVPPFKEAVEACFSAALVKVVFATETLSLGINMPARSVAIEKLTKFSGERNEFLTPGEYTQLTGRAGRRGIDEVGYAVVLWSPFVPFDQVASLAGTRTYALTSSFRPTYNMAANLVRRYAPDTAHHLLNLSFAQYRTDGEVVRLEAHLELAEANLREARSAATCDRGDIEEYRRLAGEAAPAPSEARAVSEALDHIKPGDVLLGPGRGPDGRVAVISTARRKGGELRLKAVNRDAGVVTLAARDFEIPPRPVGRVELPEPYAPGRPAFQRQVAAALTRARLRSRPAAAVETPARRRAGAGAADHPVASCPDLARHLRAADRAVRVAREVERLERRIRGRAESLARQFDRVLRVLEALGYVKGWSLTTSGTRLARLYHEADLLVAECLERGLFDDLDAPSVAALASTFTYEARGPAGEVKPPAWPNRRLLDRWAEVQAVSAELNDAEEDAGLPLTRRPDAGFAAMAYEWAAGHDLEEVIGDEELSGGDFVRNVKQLIDLLRQLGETASAAATAGAARGAADRLFRGVIAASSVVTEVPGPDDAEPDDVSGAGSRAG